MASTPNGVELVDQSLWQPLMAIHRQVAYDDDLFGDSYHKSYKCKEKLPTIPDLRFEYSYLRGVRQYVHVERMYSVSTQQHRRMSTEEILNDHGKVGLSDVTSQGGSQRTSVQGTSQSPKEVIHVQWKKAIWATTRDQVISPFLQGAFWCVVAWRNMPSSGVLTNWQGNPCLYLQPVCGEIRTSRVCQTTSKRG